jgi:hypothetical protein
MRKSSIFVTVTLLAGLIFPLHGARAEKTWQAGATLGGNGAKFNGDQVGLYISVPRANLRGAVGDKDWTFVGGGFVRRSFSDIFAVQLEALYSQKGGKGNVYGTIDIDYGNTTGYPGSVTGELTVSLDYIEIPALAVFTFPGEERMTLKAVAGAYVAFNVAAESRLEGKVTIPTEAGYSVIVDFDETYSLKNRISPVDFGGVVGGGFEIAMKRFSWVFDARAVFGLTTVDDSGDRKTRNQIFTFSAGVAVPFGSEL